MNLGGVRGVVVSVVTEAAVGQGVRPCVVKTRIMTITFDDSDHDITFTLCFQLILRGDFMLKKHRLFQASPISFTSSYPSPRLE